MQRPAVETAEAPPQSGTGIAVLFLLFSRIGLSSFGGGVPAWMHRELVETRGWLAELDFSAALAWARILPGANAVNLAVLVGHRLMGVAGAAASVMGLLVGPSLVVIGLASLARRFGSSIVLDAALEGAAAASAGLLIAIALKSGARIVRTGVAPRGRDAAGFGAIAIFLAMFLLVGVFRFSTVAVVLCLAPCSCALDFSAGTDRPRGRRRDGG